MWPNCFLFIHHLGFTVKFVLVQRDEQFAPCVSVTSCLARDIDFATKGWTARLSPGTPKCWPYMPV